VFRDAFCPAEQGGRERVCSDCADSFDVSPALWARADQTTDAAEAGEQRTGSLGGDTRHGRKNLDAGFRQLGHPTRTSSGTRLSRVTHRETVKPKRRIGRIAAPKNRYAELDDCQESTADRVRMSRSRVELLALNQQEWRDRLVTDLPHLLPETSASERSVEIGDRFALDQDAAANTIIARRKRLDGDDRTEPLKCSRNATPALEHIRRDQGNRVILGRDPFVDPQRHSCSLDRQQDGAAAPSGPLVGTSTYILPV
jgi:hypothetical protein